MATRVLVVVGTRPEAIKMAPVVLALRRNPKAFRLRVCATGQHREMLAQALEPFHIAPDIDLRLMRSDQTPAQFAGRVFSALDPVLRRERPDWVLVQGDTTTVAAAALCAHYNNVLVGHVEAGLRSFDRANPFPEETNRIVADHVSDLNFAPTQRARENLLGEGIPDSSIRVTGNTVIDALLHVAGRGWVPTGDDPLQQLAPDLKWLLVTAHRRESFGEPLRRICVAIRKLAERDDVQIIYPVHLNPQVRIPVHEMLREIPRVMLLPPVDYQRLVYLMKHAYLVLTDSGGIQEEAPSLGAPVLVLREVTERPEAVECGAARLVGTGPARIVSEAEQLLDDPAIHASMTNRGSPFGDGHAADRIVESLLRY